MSTATLPVQPLVPVPAGVCPAGVAWCRDQLNYHSDDGAAVHGGEFVIVAGDQAGKRGASHESEVWLLLERDDETGPGQPRVWLSAGAGLSTGELNLPLDQAEDLAGELLRLVAQARGRVRRASDLRPGDVVVHDGMEYPLVQVMHDGAYCGDLPDGRRAVDGAVWVADDANAQDAEWLTWYAPGDLVTLAGGAR